MSEKTSMLELLNERLTEEEIIKLICDYDLKFCELEEENKRLKQQLQQRENIIKEVREYINNHLYMESTGGIQHPTFDGKMNRDTDGFEMLEILDKENK